MAALYARDDDEGGEVPSLYVKCFETKCQTPQYAIRTIFAKAREMSPCLLIFEDLDSLVSDDIRSYFLNEVDGLESNDGILMIGSTNHLNRLDPAISKRPSRFDRKYHFEIPGVAERRAYAGYWRNKLVKNENVEFPEELEGVVAQLTEGFSFAYLKELFVMALLSLVRGDKGEDFEIVEREEADSAPSTPEPEAAAQEEICQCVAKCGTCDKPLPITAGEEEKKKQDEAQHAQEIVQRNKRVVPSVNIPETLRDNLLLRIIKYQIRILHADMDNSKGGAETGAAGKKTGA